MSKSREIKMLLADLVDEVDEHTDIDSLIHHYTELIMDVVNELEVEYE